MSNYTKTTDFEAKDSLPTGDSGKIIRGAEFETEFDAISTAIATKADTAGPTFTGTLTFETISDGTIGVTAFVDEDDMSSDSATLVPTQQSVKAYVDSQVTAQDLDFQADSGGALSIDLDSETLTFTGGTGIDTSGSGNAVTFAIDSTVATLTGTQTLTNKTLTAPTISGNLTTDGTIDGRDVATDGSKLDGIEAGATADQTAAEIRTLVDSASDSNVFTDADHTKLDGIEANATADQTAAEIRTLVDSASDSNVFTDADHSKLDGIEASATADQTDAEIRAAVEAATDSNVFTDADHSKLDGIEALADVTDTTNVTAAGALMDSELTNITAVKSLDQGVATTDTPTFAGLATSANVTFGDNDKAIFGAGSDLQIYHSGSQSFVQENGTGQLVLDTQNGARVKLTSNNGTENMVVANKDGDVELYYDNAQKLATTSTGVDVTGTVTADAAEVSKAQVTTNFDTSAFLRLHPSATTNSGGFTNIFFGTSTTNNYGISIGGERAGTDAAPDFAIRTHNANGTGVQRLRIEDSGDISFYEDTGTTAKFFWDASAESLGIGSTSPDSGRKLHIEGGDTTVGITLKDTAGTQYGITSDNNSFTIRNDSLSSDRLVIDTSGNVGIGRSTNLRDKLTVSSEDTGTTFGPTTAAIDITNTDSTGFGGYAGVNFRIGAGSYNESLAAVQAQYTAYSGNVMGELVFGTRKASTTDVAEAMRIDSSGNVGIGTISPDGTLHVHSGSAGTITAAASANNLVVENNGPVGLSLLFDDAASNAYGNIYWGNETDGSADGRITYFGSTYVTAADRQSMEFRTAGTARMRIDSSGNVGIGTSSPSFINGSGLEIQRAGVATLRLEDTGSSGKAFELSVDDGTGAVVNSASSGLPMIFKVINSEAMRIDTSGNLLVGKTSASASNTGAELRNGVSTHAVLATSSSATPIQANRKTNDGSIIDLLKDGLTVGSIGSRGSGTSFITLKTSSGSGAGLTGTDNGILPMDESALADNNTNLGSSSYRFKDLYLSGAWKSVGDLTLDTAAASSNIILKQNGTERWRINTNGVLSINNTVLENIGGTPSDLNSTEMGSGYLNLNRDDTASAVQIQFGKNGSVAGSIVTTTSTTYNTTSDRRAKENIADADDAGAIVDSIQVRKFDWKGDGIHQRYGMIAQELLESAPEVVHQPENTEQMMGVDYSKLVPMLVKEIQSLRARVAELESN